MLVLGCLVMGLFFGLGAAVGSPFWITYATEDVIGLSLSEWGTITAANTLVGTLIGLPLARIADRKGRLYLLFPSIILTPVAIVGFLRCSNFIQTFFVSILITVLGPRESKTLYGVYGIYFWKSSNYKVTSDRRTKY